MATDGRTDHSEAHETVITLRPDQVARLEALAARLNAPGPLEALDTIAATLEAQVIAGRFDVPGGDLQARMDALDAALDARVEMMVGDLHSLAQTTKRAFDAMCGDIQAFTGTVNATTLKAKLGFEDYDDTVRCITEGVDAVYGPNGSNHRQKRGQ